MTDLDPRPAPPTREDLSNGFDAFYKEARERLLLQTFALTGDLTASRSAVRDAFVVAWHHWRKLSRTAAPEMQVRPMAWRNAARRTTARPWGRTKNVSESARATLEALGALSGRQRAALLLTQLAAVTMPEMAREIGVPLEQAERELQSGAAAFSTQRDIPTASIPLALAELGTVTAGARWPRPSIIRRAGGARRRAHTVLGVTAVAVLLVGAGAVVGDPTGASPTLDRERPATSAAVPMPAAPISLPDTALLTGDAVGGRLAGRGWKQTRTNDNSTGNGLVHPCQTQRYADPKGVAAWVRTFRLSEDGKNTRTLVQTAEASGSDRAARRSFRTARSWFSACAPAQDAEADTHVQLVSTAGTPGVGDDAAVFVLRSTAPDATYVVGLARTGRFTTAVSLRTDVLPHRADRDAVAGLLGDAVNRLCALPDAGACAPDQVSVEDVPALPVRGSSGLLAEIDLPSFDLARGALIGTKVRQVTSERGDLTTFGCETVRLIGRYGKREVRSNLYRTFVFVDAGLPATAGLTEVVGTLPGDDAAAFVAQLRNQIDRCPDLDAGAGTEVAVLASESRGDSALAAWHLTTEISDDRSVEFDVAVVRNGDALAQLVYVAAPGASMAAADFVALARRAGERIATLPRYRRD